MPVSAEFDSTFKIEIPERLAEVAQTRLHAVVSRHLFPFPFPMLSPVCPSARRRRLLLLGALLLSGAPVRGADLWLEVEAAEAFAETQVRAQVNRLPNTTTYPEATASAPSGGVFNTRSAGSGWTNGHWTGMLWHLAERGTATDWGDIATAFTLPLAGRAGEVNNHDVGFLLLLSYGEAYRVTGDPAFQAPVIQAAGSLDTHWMPLAGGYWSFNFNNSGIRSKQNIIIDTTMNIELMLRGARWTENLTWYDRAVSHLRLVGRDFIREDGSTRQVVNYNQTTGEPEFPGIRWQGYSTGSTWSRGLGWGLYGLVAGARETGKEEFLVSARRMVAFHQATAPVDGVAYWDYIAPTLTQDQLIARYGSGWSGQPVLSRDTSAAALTAAALLEMATLETTPEARWQAYRLGERVLGSLIRNHLATDGAVQAILKDGTTTFPSVERGLVYGDVYFLEAIRRYAALVRPESEFAPGDAGATTAWRAEQAWRWQVRHEEGEPRWMLGRGWQEASATHVWSKGEALSTGSLAVRVRPQDHRLIRPALAAELVWTVADGSRRVARAAAGEGRSGIFRVLENGTEEALVPVASSLLPNDWVSLELVWDASEVTFRVNDTTLGVSSGSPVGAVGLGGNGPMLFDDAAWQGISAGAPTPQEAWRTAAFGEQAGAFWAADLADVDEDGWPNLLEYALGMDPLVESRADVAVDETGTLRFARSASATDVDVIAEWSADLTTWLPVPTQEAGDGFREATPPVAGDGFFRLRVQAVP